MTVAPPPTSRRRRLRWWIALAVALVLAAVIAAGSVRTAAGPAAGRELAGRASIQTVESTTIRLATYNIHGGVGKGGRRNLALTAAALRDFDYVGLNEVHGPSLVDPRDQARILGEDLGTRWLFAPSERRWWHEHFGNGLLARLPVRDWERIPLPCSQWRGFRNMVLARTTLGGQTLTILVTHIDRRQDRIPQLDAVRARFLTLPEPAVLMGDLNSAAADPAMRLLLGSPGVMDAVGQAMGEKAPAGRIDWILVRGLRTLEAGLLDNGASDHPLAWAKLALP